MLLYVEKTPQLNGVSVDKGACLEPILKCSRAASASFGASGSTGASGSASDSVSASGSVGVN